MAGTLTMISTWTEIPVALQLIQSGFCRACYNRLNGPAACGLSPRDCASGDCGHDRRDRREADLSLEGESGPGYLVQGHF